MKSRKKTLAKMRKKVDSLVEKKDLSNEVVDFLSDWALKESDEILKEKKKKE